MKSKQFVLGLWLTGAIVVLMTEPTRSEQISSLLVHQSIVSTDANKGFIQQIRLITKEQTVEPIQQIRQVSEIENPAKSD
jgi:iron complex outermembrane receptor protein